MRDKILFALASISFLLLFAAVCVAIYDMCFGRLFSSYYKLVGALFLSSLLPLMLTLPVIIFVPEK